jgi:hypothetical protein
MIDPADNRLWRRFTLSLALVTLALAGTLYAAVVLLDPYGLRAAPGAPPQPLMDLNQRFMYPQVVRSGRYDSAVFGTSTVRLLNPDRLSDTFGGRFANLGLNAGTPWEQMQLADLFLRHVPAPKELIFGLDLTWCETDANEKKLTFRAFPPWLYDEDRLNDYPELLNLTSLEIAGRVALNRLGLMPERIRSDGYEVFVPDEALYDLERARLHIRNQVHLIGPATQRKIGRKRLARVDFPALAWLDATLARLPKTTAVTLTMMPIHVALQPAVGSRDAALDQECKGRIAQLAERHRATVVDFRLRSPVTTDDSNYWDALHYRVGIADRIIAAIAEARRTGQDAADGFYRVSRAPR